MQEARSPQAKLNGAGKISNFLSGDYSDMSKKGQSVNKGTTQSRSTSKRYSAQESLDNSRSRQTSQNNSGQKKQMEQLTNQTRITDLQWQEEYQQRVNQSLKKKKSLGDYGIDSSVSSGSQLTQNQTHTGNGAQQNLFIKNLFFISSGATTDQKHGNSNNEGIPNTTRNEGSMNMGFPIELSSYESIPHTSSSKNRGDGSKASNGADLDYFSQSRSSNLQTMNFSQDRGINSSKSIYQNRSPKMPHQSEKASSSHSVSSERKAIDLAAKVLQQLAPLTVSTDQIRLITQESDTLGGQLRVNQEQAFKNQINLEQRKGPSPKNNILEHAKSASPVKTKGINRRVESINTILSPSQIPSEVTRQKADGIRSSVILLTEGQKVQKDSQIDQKDGLTNQVQEINLFGNSKLNQHKTRPSYGEIPKLNSQNSKLSPQKVGSNNKSQSRNRQDIHVQVVKNNQIQTQNIKNSSSSRNTGEVFNYRMKTLNPAAKREQMLKPAFSHQESESSYGAAGTKVVINVEEKSDNDSSVRNKSYSHNKKQSITKSQSQQAFVGIKKQQSETQQYIKNNEVMHISTASIHLKPQNLLTGQESMYGDTSSQHNHQRQESAYGDKQSEISSNIDRVDRQNIRVMARFRPLNDIENELIELNPQKGEMVLFDENEQSIKLQDEYQTHSSNLEFTFDQVFSTSTSQEKVFEVVGRSMIEDIMQGYNGTIFAYGQTGSGKTFTMYGADLFDETMMGIVPRAARQIFNFINSQDLEIEYSIRIQMIEIYKETLRDLLHNSNTRAPELKIKEDPKRGTYVEGLNDVCITSEEEIMAVICTGETMRHVASTQMNRVSSRSHSICIIDIVQKYPNDSERRGILNLVDLAGSERVSRSMAAGSTLEEAKKINFSLSMLGKVINSLTKNSTHIPYRDSKLTRLLKESLGGNNKTSLIVACSPHYSNFEETLSSLRFAQSAKKIQNKVKMNIKTSNEQLKLIIQQLKDELRNAQEEIFRLRLTSSQISQQNNSILSCSRQDNDYQNQQLAQTSSQTQYIQPLTQSIIGSTPLQAIHNLPHQSLSSKNHEVIETNNNTRLGPSSLLHHYLAQDILPTVTQFSPQKTQGSKNHIPVNIAATISDTQRLLEQLAAKNEELELKMQSKDNDLEAMQFQKDEMQIKLQSLEEKNFAQKQRIIQLEKEIIDVSNNKEKQDAKEIVQSHKMRSLENQIDTLNQQVKCLQVALEDSDMRYSTLSSQHQQLLTQKISDFFQSTFKVLNIPVSEALQTMIQLPKNLQSLEKEQVKNVSQQQFDSSKMLEVKLKDSDLLMQNLYSIELLNAVEEGSMPMDVLVYLLKNQLIEVCLANHNLQRLLHVQQWRNVIEIGELKSKSEQCKDQSQTIEKLENIVETQRTVHDKLQKRIDKLEAQLNTQKAQQLESELAVLWNECPSNLGSGVETMNHRGGVLLTQGFETMRSVNPNNQSLVSGSLMNSSQAQPQIINMKTRFSKPITSKSVKRMFSSRHVDASPASRASFGRSLQGSSLMLSHYYHLKNNAAAKQFFINKHTQLSQVDSKTIGESGSSQSNLHAAGGNSNSNKMLFDDNERLGTFEAEMERSLIVRSQLAVSQRQRAVSHNNQQVILTKEDLKRIEGMESIENVKAYLLSKLGGGMKNNTSVQGEKRAATASLFRDQERKQRKASPSPTDLNMREEEEEEEDQFGRVSDTSVIQKESAPQSTLQLREESKSDKEIQEVFMPKGVYEPMLTQGSDQFLNSFAQQHQLFGMTTTANQYQHHLELVDRLNLKIHQLREDLSLQRLRGDELKKAFLENRALLQQERALYREKELNFTRTLSDEIFQWEQALGKVKDISEKELMKKQREIEKLHQLLAKWIESHQKLEHSSQNKAPLGSLLMSGVKKRTQDIVEEGEGVSHRGQNEILLTGTPMNSNEQQYLHTEAPVMPSSFLRSSHAAHIARTVEKQHSGAFGQIKQVMRASLKSPPTLNQYHHLQTPQGKASMSLYRPLATEVASLRAGGIIPPPNVITQASCTSPKLKLMLSDNKWGGGDARNIEQTQKVIMGDTSPAVQHHSSMDDEDSGSDHEEIQLRKPTAKLRDDKGVNYVATEEVRGPFESTEEQKIEEDRSASLESSHIVLNLQSQSHQCLAESDLVSRNSMVNPSSKGASGPILIESIIAPSRGSVIVEQKRKKSLL